jgi:hypothetical protein
VARFTWRAGLRVPKITRRSNRTIHACSVRRVVRLAEQTLRDEDWNRTGRVGRVHHSTVGTIAIETHRLAGIRLIRLRSTRHTIRRAIHGRNRARCARNTSGVVRIRVESSRARTTGGETLIRGDRTRCAYDADRLSRRRLVRPRRAECTRRRVRRGRVGTGRAGGAGVDTKRAW